MSTKKVLPVVSTVIALVLLAGSSHGSNALARGLGPVQNRVTLPDARRPSNGVEQILAQSAMAGGPIGNRFVIGNQSVDTVDSAVAYSSQNQEYLVVWRNDRPANDDIYGQRVSKNGTLVGPWFSVAAGAGVEHFYPGVAYNSQHNEYLVIWGDGYNNIHGQRVSSTGLLLGSVWNIASASAGDKVYFPAVAYGSGTDQYLIVFVYEDSGGNSTIGLVGCAYDAFICLSATTGLGTATYHYVPDVAYNPRRNEFLVVWREFTFGPTAKHIYGRRVDLAGVPSVLGSVIQISNVSQSEDDPAVTVVPRSPDGQYIVAWYTYDLTAKGNIWAQRLAGDGTLEGGAISIASTPDDEVLPATAANAGIEQYVITWTRRDATYSHSNIQGRAIRTNGSFASEVRDMIPAPPGLVGPTTPENSAIAAGPGGDFLITFDDVLLSLRKVYGILWGNRMYLPLLTR